MTSSNLALGGGFSTGDFADGPFQFNGERPSWFSPGSLANAYTGNFNFNLGYFPDANLPVDTRGNVVWTLGYNVTAGGNRESTSEPALALHFETYYHLGGTDPDAGMEWHLQSVDLNGTGYRPLTFYLPRNALTSAQPATGSILVGVLNLGTYAAQQRVKYDFTGATSLVSHPVSITYFFDINNTTVFKQKNAAGSGYVYLPYADQYDRVVVNSSPVSIAGATTDSSQGAIFNLQTSTIGASDKYLYKGDWSNSVTGNVRVFYVGGQATGDALVHVDNYGTGNVVYHAEVVNSAGDPKVKWSVRSAQDWSEGIDNSDSDKWKLASNGNLETNTRVIIDTSGNIVMGGATADAALATNATNGWIYGPASAGAPSGTPAATYTGHIPFQFDSTNNKLYAYLNGAWKSVTLA